MTVADWKHIECIIDLLAPFKEATVFLSQEEVLPSWVIPIYNTLMDHVETYKAPSALSSKISTATKAGFSKLKTYYTYTGEVVMLTTALDPRRRLAYFKNRKFPSEWVGDMYCK
jgi:hypothetical protein